MARSTATIAAKWRKPQSSPHLKQVKLNVKRKELQKEQQNEYLKKIMEVAEERPDGQLAFVLQDPNPKWRATQRVVEQTAKLNQQLQQTLLTAGSYEEIQLILDQHAPKLNYITSSLLLQRLAELSQAPPSARRTAAPPAPPQSLVQQATGINLSLVSWFQPAQFAGVASSLARLGVKDTQLWEELVHTSLRKLGAFTLDQLVQMLDGVMRVGFIPNANWTSKLEVVACRLLHRSSPDQLALLIHCFAELGNRPRKPNYNALINASAKGLKFNTFRPESLARLVVGLSKFKDRRPSPMWLQRCERRLVPHVRQLDATLAIEVLYALVALHHRPMRPFSYSVLETVREGVARTGVLGSLSAPTNQALPTHWGEGGQIRHGAGDRSESYSDGTLQETASWVSESDAESDAESGSDSREGEMEEEDWLQEWEDADVEYFSKERAEGGVKNETEQTLHIQEEDGVEDAAEQTLRIEEEDEVEDEAEQTLHIQEEDGEEDAAEQTLHIKEEDGEEDETEQGVLVRHEHGTEGRTDWQRGATEGNSLRGSWNEDDILYADRLEEDIVFYFEQCSINDIDDVQLACDAEDTLFYEDWERHGVESQQGHAQEEDYVALNGTATGVTHMTRNASQSTPQFWDYDTYSITPRAHNSGQDEDAQVGSTRHAGSEHAFQMYSQSRTHHQVQNSRHGGDTQGVAVADHEHTFQACTQTQSHDRPDTSSLLHDGEGSKTDTVVNVSGDQQCGMLPGDHGGAPALDELLDTGRVVEGVGSRSADYQVDNHHDDVEYSNGAAGGRPGVGRAASKRRIERVVTRHAAASDDVSVRTSGGLPAGTANTTVVGESLEARSTASRVLAEAQGTGSGSTPIVAESLETSNASTPAVAESLETSSASTPAVAESLETSNASTPDFFSSSTALTTISDNEVEVLGPLHARHFAYLSFSISSLHLSPDAAWMDMFIQLARKNLHLFDASHSVDTLHSLAAIGYIPPADFVQEALKELTPQVAALPPQGVVMLLSALTRLGFRPSGGWMREMLRATGERIEEFELPQLSGFMVGVALMGERPAVEWMEKVVQLCTPRKLDEFVPSHLANFLWALAVLRYKPAPIWLGSACRALQQRCTALDCTDLGNVAWSLAQLKHRPSNAWLQVYLRETSAKMPYMDARNLLQMTWALALFRARPSEAWLSQLQQVGASLMEEMTPEQIEQLSWSIECLKQAQEAYADIQNSRNQLEPALKRVAERTRFEVA